MTTIAAAQSTSQTASTAKSDKSIAGDFDQFLRLLTTQLKNQDPTAPLDTNQFTQQLVQFAQVEQQLKQNETLTALLSLSKSASTTNAMSFVGNRVTMDGATSQLKDAKPSRLGGLDVIYPESFSPGDHQGNKRLGVAVIRDGFWQVVG